MEGLIQVWLYAALRRINARRNQMHLVNLWGVIDEIEC